MVVGPEDEAAVSYHVFDLRKVIAHGVARARRRVGIEEIDRETECAAGDEPAIPAIETLPPAAEVDTQGRTAVCQEMPPAEDARETQCCGCARHNRRRKECQVGQDHEEDGSDRSPEHAPTQQCMGKGKLPLPKNACADTGKQQ